MTLSKIKKVGVFSNSADSEEIVARAKHVNPIVDVVNGLTDGTGALNAASITGTLLNISTQTLAAAGSAQGNAGKITGQLVFVTDADATKGVILPTVTNGKFIIVVNTANAVLKIYPASGEKIQGGTANANISLAAYSVFLCGYKASGDWYGTEITAGAVA